MCSTLLGFVNNERSPFNGGENLGKELTLSVYFSETAEALRQGVRAPDCGREKG